MAKVAHMVGNGPSSKDFFRISDQDFVVGCNMPSVPVDVSFICDKKFLLKVRDGKVPYPTDTPIMGIKQPMEYVKTENKKRHPVMSALTLYQSEPFDPGTNRLTHHSSGHYAVMWLIRELGYDEIHVWGCDSLIERNISSSTDQYVGNGHKQNKGHGERFSQLWIENWRKVVTWFPHVKFVFHNIPSGSIDDALKSDPKVVRKRVPPKVKMQRKEPAARSHERAIPARIRRQGLTKLSGRKRRR